MTTNAGLIILNITKIRESSLVIHTLSREFGRRSFIVRAGKGTPMALLQPLGVVDAEISENPKSDLWKASRLSAVHPLNGIRSNLVKNAMTLFMSEVLYRTVKDGACEEGLFERCVKSILTLDALERDYVNFHVWWLLELAAALGFAPEAEDLAPFAGEHYALLAAMVRSPFEEVMLMQMSGQTRNELCESLIRYLSFHTDCKLDIRSLKVLRELFT